MGLRSGLLVWLNGVLALFLVDAGLSLLDDLSGLGPVRPLAPIRGLCSLFMLLASLLTYLMLAFVPAIPKRWFLPLSLFGPVWILLLPLISIYHYSHLGIINLGVSVVQLATGVWMVRALQGGWQWRWPWIRAEHLMERPLRWPRLMAFFVLNGGVLLPAIVIYLAFCVHLAVDHFTAGFLRADTGGLTAIAKKYTRADGEVIQLIPMMHIGESRFYDELSRSVPTNSIILLEGVSDRKGRLKNELSYERVAKSMGLEEQKDEFDPARGHPRNADIDVSEFSAKTLELLNLVVAYHAKGASPELIRELMEKGQDPAALQGLWNDLLTMRNEHLLKEIRRALKEDAPLWVPWGAAHMPGISQGLEAEGFRVVERTPHRILHFQTLWQRLRQSKASTAP